MQNKTYKVPSWFQGWYTFDHALQKLERGLLVLGIFTILGIGIVHILLRNIVGQGFSFSDVLSQHLTVWLGLIGATLATASSEHISIDAFSRVLQKRGLKINKIVIGLAATLGSAILTYRTVIFLLFYYHSKTGEFVHLGTTKIPLLYFLVVFPYAFGLITLRYFMQTLELLYIPADQFQQEHTGIESSTTATEISESPMIPVVSSEQRTPEQANPPKTGSEGGTR